MNVKVSVIIPFYSNFTWLNEAVESVLEQTMNNYEIILINDGSPENDTEFLKAYENKIIYLKTTNRGAAAARNLGIENARGEYIAFLDSDDLWRPEKLELQLEYMKYNNVIWSHTGYELFNSKNGKILKVIDPFHFSGDVFIRSLTSSPIATPCIMIRREFLTKNPEIRFAENMRYGEDSFFWLKIANLEPLGVINQTLSEVRIRGGNAALQARAQIEAKAQLWKYIKANSHSISKYDSIPKVIKIAYSMCHFNFKILIGIEKKLKIKPLFSEFFAKLLYASPYLILKIYSLTHENKK